jgi:hypothetical protein
VLNSYLEDSLILKQLTGSVLGLVSYLKILRIRYLG